jgi:hypothetical protein
MFALVLSFAAATQVLAEPALQPFASFVGHCWSGDAPGGGGTDTHCFEAVYGGQHIRDRHTVVVNGKRVYEGEALYSVEAGAITFTYWNSIGGVGHGSASAAGAEMHFNGQMRPSPSSQAEPMKATWRTVADGYEVIWPDGTPHLMRRSN